MRRALLTLLLAGSAAYAANALVVIPEPVAVQSQPTHNVRHLRSWGSTLSDLPIVQKRQTQLASYQKPAPLPLRQVAAADDRPLTSAIDAAEHEPVEWIKVALAARVHSEPSVSSATVRYYSAGTELQVVKREDGWVGVTDPVTQERGWVFTKYLASIDGPSHTQAAIDSAYEGRLVEPTPAEPALPNAKKRTLPTTAPVRVSVVTPVSDDTAVTESEPQSGRWARRGDRRRGGLFAFAPFGAF